MSLGCLWLYARTSLFTLWSCAVSLTSFSQESQVYVIGPEEELVIDSFRPDPNSSGLQLFSAHFGSFTFLNNIHLADFLKTNLTNFAAIWVKKGLKAARFYFAPEKLQITPAKEQERRKRKSEKMESRRREKKMVALLVFVMATLEIVVFSSPRRGFDYLIWHCAVLIEGYSHVVCRCSNLGSKRHTDQMSLLKNCLVKL